MIQEVVLLGAAKFATNDVARASACQHDSKPLLRAAIHAAWLDEGDRGRCTVCRSKFRMIERLGSFGVTAGDGSRCGRASSA